MRYAIVYLSSASDELEIAEISKILSFTEESNNNHDITGLLLFSDGNFFQIIEGEKNSILKLFETIKRDDRHRNIQQIFGEEINKGAYDLYATNFISDEVKYDTDQFEHYLNQTSVLGKNAQKAVENILRVFIKV